MTKARTVYDHIIEDLVMEKEATLIGIYGMDALARPDYRYHKQLARQAELMIGM